MVRAVLPVTSVAIAVAGCGGSAPPGDPEDAVGDAPPPRTAPDGPAPPPPPDAGTAAGHGADPRSVAVPERDATPPRAVITLSARGGRRLAEAAMPGAAHPRRVALDRPRLHATATGEDAQSGIPRVRLSLHEVVMCRSPGGRVLRRPRVRHLPPPQVQRVRSAPGARLPVTRRQPRSLSLSTRACGAGTELVTLHGEVWAEATNGLGLEAVTPHLRFAYRPGATPSRSHDAAGA